jgi:exodeoxyribonuclease V alpha subunit
MVDLPLMARLLDACPDDARIILLGDENQLSSIQVGTVLSDLMDASNTSNHPIRDCSVTLRKSYRTKGPISGACDAIRDGDADKAWETMTQSPKESMTEGAITQQSPPTNLRAALEPFVVKHWLPVLRDESLDPLDRIKKIDQFRILTPTHLGLYGVESINHTVDKILSAHGILQPDVWYPGRSVIVQKNDYTMGIYNGDIGLALTTTENDNDDLQVCFQAGEKHKAISPALLPECKTAWALTIHRTQGSEYDHILLIIPSSEESKILSRELLYTGLSRAKKSATIWCREKSLRQTITTTVHRASGLSDMFKTPSEAYQSAL